MITYLFLGLLFALFIDLLTDWLRWTGQGNYQKLNMQDRILCVFIWPIGLLVFLIGFIKTRYRL